MTYYNLKKKHIDTMSATACTIFFYKNVNLSKIWRFRSWKLTFCGYSLPPIPLGVSVQKVADWSCISNLSQKTKLATDFFLGAAHQTFETIQDGTWWNSQNPVKSSLTVTILILIKIPTCQSHGLHSFCDKINMKSWKLKKNQHENKSGFVPP